MASTPPVRECAQCGAEMTAIDAWSAKSPPLIGGPIEHAEYKCPKCGAEALFKRREDDDDWQPA